MGGGFSSNSKDLKPIAPCQKTRIVVGGVYAGGVADDGRERGEGGDKGDGGGERDYCIAFSFLREDSFLFGWVCGSFWSGQVED